LPKPIGSFSGPSWPLLRRANDGVLRPARPAARQASALAQLSVIVDIFY